jgi:hypothetical protein
MLQYPCQKKKYLEHYYNAFHSSKYDADFPCEIEIRKLKELKSKLAAKELMAKPRSLSKNGQQSVHQKMQTFH